MGLAARIRLAATFAAALPLLLITSPTCAGEVVVILELSQQFYYENDALDVRITVHNAGDAKVENPIKSGLFDGIHVRRGGEQLERTGTTSTEEPPRPERLAADAFYGTVVNLIDLFPQLRERGMYEIYWGADQILSEMLVVTVIPRYDLTKQYQGVIETDRGKIVIDLFGRESPLAVKAFSDLAHAGFYDDSLISEVRDDDLIVGGDPRFASPPRDPIQFPAEVSELPIVAGTVVMRPARQAPPANGSTFAILLRPKPEWKGQVTVLGQVVEGLDVVQRLSKLPSTLQTGPPNFKPIQDVKIKSVAIHEKTVTPPGS